MAVAAEISKRAWRIGLLLLNERDGIAVIEPVRGLVRLDSQIDFLFRRIGIGGEELRGRGVSHDAERGHCSPVPVMER